MSYSQRAAIYEVEYQEIRDVPFVLSLLKQDGVNRVIEVPCGAGRLSRHLAPHVSHLDVIDLEPDMVTRAVAVAKAAGPNCEVRGHVQDMRAIRLDHLADLAILPREGLQLVAPEDGKKVLSSLAQNIAPNGRIFVDVACFVEHQGTPDPDYFRPGQADGIVNPDWSRDLPGGGILHRSSAQQDEGASIVFDLTYNEVSDSSKTWSSRMRIYRYGLDVMETLTPEGMRLEKTLGDYDGTPLQPASRRILALYRKLPD